MKRIGLISDTHGYIHPRIYDFFSDCDEIWHAGDIGNYETAASLAKFKLLRAVHGNIDGTEVRSSYPRVLLFPIEEVKVFITHIGGYPGRYEKEAISIIRTEKPGIFISGHSHILKVIYDQKNQLLHINPGAAGKSGMHHLITFIRFIIDGKDIRELEICEIPRASQIKTP
ncbi:MAG: metallophosphoesterase family protein [Bacteroidales bacterium]|nr:metallophosphoesterase family protein [Bacteroidales bacterium]